MDSRFNVRFSDRLIGGCICGASGGRVSDLRVVIRVGEEIVVGCVEERILGRVFLDVRDTVSFRD